MTPTAQTLPRKRFFKETRWRQSIPFFLVHVLAVATPFITGVRWEWVVLALASYYVRMIWITMGYHRYLSHRSFKTSRVFQFVLAFLSTTSAQKGALWWAANHRHHHKYSDQPEDVHSPKRGFWWSHMGWILSSEFEETKTENIKDLTKYPELVWLNKHHLVPVVAYALPFLIFGGWQALLWGFVVGTVMLWHGTFFINSLAHVFGKRRYETTDTSRNSMILALMTSGEGWHNNHHHYQSTANQGWFWWEIDVTWYVLRALSAVGLVWDLRTPPEHVKKRDRIVSAPAEARPKDVPTMETPPQVAEAA